MLKFQAKDGYSYLITFKSGKVFRIDSEKVNLELGTFDEITIQRLDISPEVSKKLAAIRRKIP